MVKKFQHDRARNLVCTCGRSLLYNLIRICPTALQQSLSISMRFIRCNTMYEWTLLCVRTLKTMPKHISTVCVQRFNNTVRTLLQCQSPCRTIPKHTYKPNVRSKNTLQFTPTRNALLIRYMYSNAFKLRVLLDEQLVLLSLVA